MGAGETRHQSMSSSVEGITTDSYAGILSWNCLGYLKKTLILACIHESNDLMYQIRGLALSGSKYYNELKGETLLAHGNVQFLVIDDLFSMIIVEIKSATSGRASSFNIDYCGGPRPKVYASHRGRSNIIAKFL